MRRLLAAPAAILLLAIAAPTAGAEIIEIGQTPEVARPACPDKPCLAMTRTTGYQAKVGTARGLMTIPKSGRIVAWTVALGNPGPEQVKYFQTNYGGPSQAQLVLLKPGSKLNDTVMAMSPIVQLEPYFNSTAQFPLVRSIPVHKGWVVGITVPTWAPILAVGLGNDTSWRASRAQDKCDDNSTQTAQLALQDVTRYLCLYRTARVTYSATLIAYPTHPKKTGTTTTPTTTTTTPTTTTTTATTPTTTTPTQTTTTPKSGGGAGT
ncbi:MAG TPA: hypothetical protein VHB30_05965 [Solirubrobacteraceae bacterium]|nr:hypothetical protein [Solirubrobacteraceae bacterium]